MNASCKSDFFVLTPKGPSDHLRSFRSWPIRLLKTGCWRKRKSWGPQQKFTTEPPQRNLSTGGYPWHPMAYHFVQRKFMVNGEIFFGRRGEIWISICSVLHWQQEGVEPPEHPKHRKVSPKDVSVPVPAVTLRPRARKDGEVFVTEAFKEENHSQWLVHESSLMLAW